MKRVVLAIGLVSLLSSSIALAECHTSTAIPKTFQTTGQAKFGSTVGSFAMQEHTNDPKRMYLKESCKSTYVTVNHDGTPVKQRIDGCQLQDGLWEVVTPSCEGDYSMIDTYLFPISATMGNKRGSNARTIGELFVHKLVDVWKSPPRIISEVHVDTVMFAVTNLKTTQMASWQLPNHNARGFVEIIGTSYTTGGKCKEFASRLEIDGDVRIFKERACSTADSKYITFGGEIIR
jgi:hypothetical protein